MGTLITKLIILCRDKPYSKLKPGQATMERNFYAEATHENPDGK
jgi:hypothetical protein